MLVRAVLCATIVGAIFIASPVRHGADALRTASDLRGAATGVATDLIADAALRGTAGESGLAAARLLLDVDGRVPALSPAGSTVAAIAMRVPAAPARSVERPPTDTLRAADRRPAWRGSLDD